MGLLGKIFDSFIDNCPFVDDNAPRVICMGCHMENAANAEKHCIA